MFDLNTIAEFSRINCVAICAVMVPLNLIFTLFSLFLVGLNTPKERVSFSAINASCYAIIMLLHVASWFTIGVVRIETFILLGLACVCLIINAWALFHGSTMRRLIWMVTGVIKGWWRKVAIALS
jgi:hypothetical protein